jgi:hypothetical protein
LSKCTGGSPQLSAEDTVIFGNIENVIRQVTGGQIDPQSLERAVMEHLSQTGSGDVAGHLRDAATTASQNGQPGIAQELMDMVAQHQANPEGLRDAAIAYIKSKPEVLTHFAPPFAQGILNRVL